MRRLLLASVLLTAACAQAEAADRAFNVGGFDRIQSSGPWDVRVHTGAAASVRAHGSPEMLNRLRIEVHGGQLSIGSTPGSWFSGWGAVRQKIAIDVTVPALSAATLSGPGDMTIDRVQARAFAASLSGPGDLTIGAIDAGHIELALRGPGDLTIGGRAATATLTLSGPGDVHADKLTVRDATVGLRGPGDLTLTASGMVKGTLSGPGDITIRGGARCMITKTGPGDVSCS